MALARLDTGGSNLPRAAVGNIFIAGLGVAVQCGDIAESRCRRSSGVSASFLGNGIFRGKRWPFGVVDRGDGRE